MEFCFSYTLKEREEPAAAARQYIATRPDIQRMMSGMILDLWPTFGALSQESILHWLAAVHLSFADCPLKDVRKIWLNNVVREYGWVLEYELKTRIFLAFRSEVQSNHERISVARTDHDNFKGEFYRFLTRKSEITLGTMVSAIEQSQASCVPTDVDFAAFLKSHAPQLVGSTSMLKRALKLRNRATHEVAVLDVETVAEMAVACRTALACICLAV